jgi:hypothetical protein
MDGGASWIDPAACRGVTKIIGQERLQMRLERLLGLWWLWWLLPLLGTLRLVVDATF